MQDFKRAPGYERAVQLEPDNAENWFLLGRYWQYNLDEPDAPRAVQAYRTAPHSRSAIGLRLAGSRYRLRIASRPLRRTRSFPASQARLSRFRRSLLALRQFSTAARRVARRLCGNSPMLFPSTPSAPPKRSHAAGVSPPTSKRSWTRCSRPLLRVYLATIRELDADAAIDPALAVWDRLVAIRPHLPLPPSIPFTDSLIQAHRIDDAHRVWDQAVALSGLPPPVDPPGSVLWDGGFETGVSGGGFAWNFAPPARGVQATYRCKRKTLRTAFPAPGLRRQPQC